MLGVNCSIQSAFYNKYIVHAGSACPALPLESILHEAVAGVPVAATWTCCVGKAIQLCVRMIHRATPQIGELKCGL